MKEFWKKRKLWAIFFPILTFLIFGSLLMYYNLQQELKLPSPNWSRSISLPETPPGLYFPFVQKEGNQYHVYTYEKGGIEHLAIDAKLNVINKTTLSVKVGKDRPFWAKGENVLYLKDDKLLLYQGGKKKVLASGIDGMRANANQIVVWKGNELNIVKAGSFKLKPAGKIDGEIRTVSLSSEANSFLVLSDSGNNRAEFNLFQKKASGDYRIRTVMSSGNGISAAPGDISGIDFAVNDQEMAITYSTYEGTHKKILRDHHFAAINLQGSETAVSVQELKFIEKSTNKFLEEPKNIRVAFENGKPVLLFSALGHLPLGDTAVNVYKAEQSGSQKWSGILVSKTQSPSRKPFWINDDTVLWIDFTDYDQYQLMGASQDLQVIARSLQLREQDWSNAFGDTLVSMMAGSLIVVFACLWLAPAGLFLGIMYVTNITVMEREPRWIKFTTMGLFTVMAVIFMPTLFDFAFQHLAPGYLAFPGSAYVIPLVLSLLAWAMMEQAKGEEWGNLGKFAYFFAMDVWMLMFLVGPYVI